MFARPDTHPTPPLTLHPLTFAPDEIGEVVALYASNPAYWRAAGEYDPRDIQAAKVEADLRGEAATEGGEVLLARDGEGRLAGVVCLLDRHPKDGLPWIGLLMVDGHSRRTGLGRRLAGLVEERFRAEQRSGIRLAVLENNPDALAFWSSLGWQEIDRRQDLAHDRPCIVMHKHLA
ncbi:GNAT family N-acetyltransferase [Streptomyces sp. 130]|uniref:GNAT family N-acetyltransferase n=1 Tax=Streptomyces sp. 130 TaxID=2591006 RepID=UPI00117E4501|nr:GNAT family N-acetyltransferase [Streptomyces sp. 130]TRV81488.1 GNAT family N-acetyltransferase [Streptomyces sp. 130]